MHGFRLIIYLLLVTLLAAATIIEQYEGTDFVMTHIYHAPWFVALWGVFAICILETIHRRRYRSLPVILLHGSFLIILGGALTTHLWGKRGFIYLPIGNEVGSYINEENRQPQSLPFTLLLDSFRIVHHPGSEIPADYVSYLHDAPPLSMNRIYVREGYRFYQASYDENGSGSWLAVSHDPWGIAITYSGYALLGITMLWQLFVHRNNYYRLFSRKRKKEEISKDNQGRKIHSFITWLLYIILLSLLICYLCRWYTIGRMPLSNGYETIQFLVLCFLSLICLLHQRFPSLQIFGLLLSAGALLFSRLGPMESEIIPLLPVLNSSLLTFHVSVIIIAYALFALMAGNGIVALCSSRQSHRLMQLSRLLLRPALFFLCTGIMLGAVWANQSWGRYWGWDPKEVWALITLMLYALPLHRRSLRMFRHPPLYHRFMVLAFLAVVMTYLGVSYLLGGMHSYVG